MDVRLNEIYSSYETKWDDSLPEMIRSSFISQYQLYLDNYKQRLSQYACSLLLHDCPLGSKDDYIFAEYKMIGIYIVWITLQRTLDLRVSYMLLQRTSIIFTQYLIQFVSSKKSSPNINYSINNLISFLIKNLIGDIEMPLTSKMNEAQTQKVWSTIIQLYSQCKLEYE